MHCAPTIHALRQALDKNYFFPMLRSVYGISYQLVWSDDPN